MNKVGISLGWNCHSACWGAGIGIRATKENGYLTCPYLKAMRLSDEDPEVKRLL